MNLIVDFGSLFLDLCGVTSDFHELWTKNSVELLLDSTSIFKIIQYFNDMKRLSEDFSNGGLEFPTMNSLLFNLVTGALKLKIPVGKHSFTLLNEIESLFGVHLKEDLVDLNFLFYLFADFVGNGAQNGNEVFFLMNDVP